MQVSELNCRGNGLPKLAWPYNQPGIFHCPKDRESVDYYNRNVAMPGYMGATQIMAQSYAVNYYTRSDRSDDGNIAVAVRQVKQPSRTFLSDRWLWKREAKGVSRSTPGRRRRLL